VLLLTLQCFSQQLISTAGQQQNNVSWSIGEIVTAGGTTSQFIIYQGFNSLESSVLSGLSDVAPSTLSVYPNPVVNELYLKKVDFGTYSYTLIDVVGSVLLNKIADSDQTIDMSHYSPGQYILKVTSNQFSKSTIIIKK